MTKLYPVSVVFIELWVDIMPLYCTIVLYYMVIYITVCPILVCCIDFMEPYAIIPHIKWYIHIDVFDLLFRYCVIYSTSWVTRHCSGKVCPLA